MKKVIALGLLVCSCLASADWKGWENETSRGVQSTATHTEFNQDVYMSFHQHGSESVRGAIRGDNGYVPNNWGQVARSQYSTNSPQVMIIMNGRPLSGSLIAGMNGWSVNFNNASEALKIAKEATTIEAYIDGVRVIFTGKGITSEANRVKVY